METPREFEIIRRIDEEDLKKYLRPVADAPKDGTKILLLFVGQDEKRAGKKTWWAVSGYWHTGRRHWTDGDNPLVAPTHWMFLPYGG